MVSINIQVYTVAFKPCWYQWVQCVGRKYSLQHHHHESGLLTQIMSGPWTHVVHVIFGPHHLCASALIQRCVVCSVMHLPVSLNQPDHSSLTSH